jgi:hypothetical protein
MLQGWITNLITAISIAGIICQAFNVLCESGSYSVHFAAVYLDAIDFVSIRYVVPIQFCNYSLTSTYSIALYGLIVFYALTREELAGRRPLAKFLAIKAIVFLAFYQSFVVSVLDIPRMLHSKVAHLSSLIPCKAMV